MCHYQEGGYTFYAAAKSHLIIATKIWAMAK
jgi:hypothetical protein